MPGAAATVTDFVIIILSYSPLSEITTSPLVSTTFRACMIVLHGASELQLFPSLPLAATKTRGAAFADIAKQKHRISAVRSTESFRRDISSNVPPKEFYVVWTE